MRSATSQQIDRLALMLAIVIFAVTFGYAALALVHNHHVPNAMQAERGGDKSPL